MKTIVWSDVLSSTLRGHFSADEIANIHRLDMVARTFFEWGDVVPDFLVLQNIERHDTRLQYDWASRSRDAVCPFCGIRSETSAHKPFENRVQDIPQGGRAVWHRVRRQIYRCLNADCAHQEFVERMPGFVDDDARKTIRFQQECVARALDSGCKPAEDALKRAGATVSNDTIGRYLKAAAARQVEANLNRNHVRVLAVDDIYLRKGDKSSGCTVFLDEETHRVLIIVRGTTKAVVQRVLESFPAATFFSRDRATAYAAAAAAAGKTQIADRFHWIHNAQQAVDEALATILPATIFLRSGDGWVPADPSGRQLPGRPVLTVPDEQIAERIHLGQLTPRQARKYRYTLKILELADRGMRSAEIAQTLDISLKEMQQFRRVAVDTLDAVNERIRERIVRANDTQAQHTEHLEARHPKTLRPRARPANESTVEPYRDLIIEKVRQGGNHRTIHPILLGQGFTGSANAIYQYILKLRQEIPEALRPAPCEPPSDLQLDQISRHGIYRQVLKQAADSRPQAADSASNPKANLDASASAPTTGSQAPSPFSDRARALMYGKDPDADASAATDTDPDPGTQKKTLRPPL